MYSIYYLLVLMISKSVPMTTSTGIMMMTLKNIVIRITW